MVDTGLVILRTKMSILRMTYILTTKLRKLPRRNIIHYWSKCLRSSYLSAWMSWVARRAGSWFWSISMSSCKLLISRSTLLIWRVLVDCLDFELGSLPVFLYRACFGLFFAVNAAAPRLRLGAWVQRRATHFIIFITYGYFLFNHIKRIKIINY